MVKETMEDLKRVRRDGEKKTEDLKCVRRGGEKEDRRPEVSQVIWLKRRRKT